MREGGNQLLRRERGKTRGKGEPALARGDGGNERGGGIGSSAGRGGACREGGNQLFCWDRGELALPLGIGGNTRRGGNQFFSWEIGEKGGDEIWIRLSLKATSCQNTHSTVSLFFNLVTQAQEMSCVALDLLILLMEINKVLPDHLHCPKTLGIKILLQKSMLYKT
jgi:hypothetical protein